jgi:hypothetical protein
MSADPIGKAHLEKEVERAFREPFGLRTIL